MKTLIVILMLLLFVGVAYANPDYLACDLQEGITASEIQVTPFGGTTTTVTGVVIVDTPQNALKVLDLTGYQPGRYIFKVRLKGASDWWGDYSDPFDATKPAKSGGVRVVH